MSRRPSIRVFDDWSIRQVVNDRVALRSAERAFRLLGRGYATVPPPMNWEFPAVSGEVHIKGAHLHSSPLFTFKVATGFYGNVELGVPTGSGLVLIFDADTGFPRGILADNGYLTDLRTAAAGALAATRLTDNRPLALTILGSGVQAQLQARLIAGVRPLASLTVWSRSNRRAERWVDKLSEVEAPFVATVAATVRDAVAGADLVVTATPSRAPLVEFDWLARGATVIAVGADGVGKQELATDVPVRADKYVTDLTVQCARLGELQHAIAAGLMGPEDVYSELGSIVLGEVPGREGDETIVCDLTGVGAQDAAIAEYAFVELTGQEARLEGD